MRWGSGLPYSYLLPLGALMGLLAPSAKPLAHSANQLNRSYSMMFVSRTNYCHGRHQLRKAVKMEIAHWVTVTGAAITVTIIFVGAAYQERFEKAQAELDANLRSDR